MAIRSALPTRPGRTRLSTPEPEVRTRRRAPEPEPEVRRRRPVEEVPARRTRSTTHEQETPVRRRRPVEDEAPHRRGRVVKTTAKSRRAEKPGRFDGVKPIREAFTRTSLILHIAETCDVDKKVAKEMLETLGSAIVGSVMPRACGKFVLPGLMRVITINKPATKARKGISPFTKEPMVFAAKPARTIVKIRVGRELKEAALG